MLRYAYIAYLVFWSPYETIFAFSRNEEGADKIHTPSLAYQSPPMEMFTYR
jgi:hypothetical protein